ncbi:MAG TPA: hypothetical protein PLW44_10455 [Chitinophagales bacterium]|nr:hypothetical protein [Chitinophagales bacterium]
MRKASILFMFCWLLSSCTSTEKLLCRTWRVDDVQFLPSATPMNDKMNELLAENMKTKLTFTFQADSVYKVNNNGKETTSKWWFAKDKKSFYAIVPNGSTVESKIESLKNGSFTVVFPPSEKMTGYKLICSPVTVK